MTLHQSATVPSSSSSQSLENVTANCSKRQCLAGSTESEVIAWDAGLRLQGIPVLNLWDVAIDVLHSSANTKSSTQGAQGNLSCNSFSNQKRRIRNVDEL